MTLRLRLLLLTVAVAALPLLLSGWLALRVHQQAMNRQLEEAQLVAARAAARLAQARLDGVVRTFQLLGAQVEWPRLTAAERQGALWLAYGQADDAAAVLLLDEDGRALGDPVYAAGEAAPPSPGVSAARPVLPLSSLATLSAALPVTAATAAASRYATQDPIAAGGGLHPLLPLALSVAGRGAAARWTLGVGISLGGLCAELGRVGGEELLLVDGKGRRLCPRGGEEVPAPLDPALAAVDRRDGNAASYRAADGSEYRVATASLGMPGWSVVARRPSDEVLAPGRRIRVQTLVALFVALLLALGAGWMIAERITRRVDRLVTGTTAIAEGQLDHRLDEGGGDELARLAESFNHMSREVQKRDEEIRAWNEELQERVSARTRELREAQEQLLRSDKLAAVHALGAGLGARILPPLNTIVSQLRQLLRRREAGEVWNDVPTLVTMDEAAQRIVVVARGLTLLSDRFADADHVPLGVPALLEEALSALEPRLAMAGIRPARFYEDLAPRVLGSADELRRSFREIYRNAIAAMPDGGTLTLSVRSLEGRALVVSIADTGKGIAPEDQERVFDAFFRGQGAEHEEDESAGLGLSIVHDVVARHHGRVDVESAVGVGTTVKMTLPALVEPRDA